MSEPHAAIVLSQLAPARRVHRPPPVARRRATTPRSTSSGCGRSPIPADAALQLLQVRRVPARRHRPHRRSSRRCASGSTSGCRARSTTRRCTSSPCSRTSPIGALPGRRVAVRPPHLPAAVSVAHRRRRRLRRRVAGSRARARCGRSDRSRTRLDRGHGRLRLRRLARRRRAPGRRARRPGPRPASRRCSRTSTGPRSTCSTRTPSPTRSRARTPSSTSRRWPT